MKKILLSISLMVFMASCATPVNTANIPVKSNISVNNIRTIKGTVQFPTSFKTKASFTDVSKQATVSIIDISPILRTRSLG